MPPTLLTTSLARLLTTFVVGFELNLETPDLSWFGSVEVD